MSFALRLVLIVGSIVVCAFFLRKIRKAQMRISDAAFWFIFALCIILLGLFPQVAIRLSSVLNIDSPANFIWLSMISLLLIREFVSAVQISQLRSKLTALTQEIALRDALGQKASVEVAQDSDIVEKL